MFSNVNNDNFSRECYSKNARQDERNETYRDRIFDVRKFDLSRQVRAWRGVWGAYGEDDGVGEVDLLEEGLPLRVGILQLLHGEGEVGDDEHQQNEVEWDRIPSDPQLPLQPQEPRLPRRLQLPPRGERREARGERLGVGAIAEGNVIVAFDAWAVLLAEEEVVGLAAVEAGMSGGDAKDRLTEILASRRATGTVTMRREP